MKSLGMLIGGVIILFLFSGCTEPKFNPNSKRIEFIEGKPFRLPYNVSRLEYPLTNSAKDKKTIARFKGYGLNCTYGQQPWMAKLKTQPMYAIDKSKLGEEEYKKQMDIFLTTAVKDGTLGCVSPLSDREYHFYQNQENQDAADRRAAAAERSAMYARIEANRNARAIERAAEKNRQAAVAASNVNVNVSGTVNHDVQHSGTVYVDSYKPYGGY